MYLKFALDCPSIEPHGIHLKKWSAEQEGCEQYNNYPHTKSANDKWTALFPQTASSRLSFTNNYKKS